MLSTSALGLLLESMRESTNDVQTTFANALPHGECVRDTCLHLSMSTATAAPRCAGITQPLHTVRARVLPTRARMESFFELSDPGMICCMWQAAAAWRGQPMPWDHVQRLWTALVESPVLASDMCGFQLALHGESL